jgi:hypothetical protein
MSESSNIFILSKADGTPYGWAFINFYHSREFIKRMCNRNGYITTMGGEDFEPFTNLTATFLPRSNLGNYTWVIQIDATKSGIEGSFPMRAHVTFADKIARAVTSTQPNWVMRSLDIAVVILTEAHEEGLNTYFPALAISEQELSLEWLFLES